MSDEELNALEEGKFEVDELDDSQLEGVAGGAVNESACNESQCGTNTSQCACPPVKT